MWCAVIRRRKRGFAAGLRRCQQGASNLIIDPSDAVARGRSLAWARARMLSRDGSSWDLEYFKGTLGEAEITLGYADLIAERALTLDVGQQVRALIPSRYRSLRTIRQALASRGTGTPYTLAQSLVDGVHFILAALLASAAFAVYLLRFGLHRTRLPTDGQLFFAVHGEWSNRTRHLLGLTGEGPAPAAILMLGRPLKGLRSVQDTWRHELGRELPVVVVPASLWSAIGAFPAIVRELVRGFVASRSTIYRPALRSHAAMIFRVMLGVIMARWWSKTGAGNGATVILGHTGTADTSLLECSQQSSGAKTVHLVHGLSAGPNFVGFSTLALFRCGIDAEQYASLRHYGACRVDQAPLPIIRRGNTGLLLLTNLAHPMNANYIASGIAGELKVLQDVAEVARALGAPAKPWRWKPHPATARLPASHQQALYEKAAALGFTVVSPRQPVEAAAAEAHWVLTTPSTSAVDLLANGYLPVVLDWERSSPDVAVTQMPSTVSSRAELKDILERLDPAQSYDQFFRASWQRLGPSRAFTLAAALENSR